MHKGYVHAVSRPYRVHSQAVCRRGFYCLCMFCWVSAGPEGCRGLNWICLATRGHCAMTGIGPSAVLTGS